MPRDASRGILQKQKKKKIEKKSLSKWLMQNDQLKKRVDTTIRLLNLVVSLESTSSPYY